MSNHNSSADLNGTLTGAECYGRAHINPIKLDSVSPDFNLCFCCCGDHISCLPPENPVLGSMAIVLSKLPLFPVFSDTEKNLTLYNDSCSYIIFRKIRNTLLPREVGLPEDICKINVAF